MQQRLTGLVERLEWARDLVETAFTAGAASPDEKPPSTEHKADEV